MPKYSIRWGRTVHYETSIEADSPEDAKRQWREQHERWEDRDGHLWEEVSEPEVEPPE